MRLSKTRYAGWKKESDGRDFHDVGRQLTAFGFRHPLIGRMSFFARDDRHFQLYGMHPVMFRTGSY
jgi:hypothetical protein